MNILYGIQGTGHGHISRAKELIPELSSYADIEVLISGYACQLDLEKTIQFRKHGISLFYDNKGSVDILKTIKGLRPIRFINDVSSIPIHKFDLIISDFEPVSAWGARMAGIKSVALSHQAAFLSAAVPRPKERSVIAESIIQYFAPADRAWGFHFKRYDTFIEPPIIRKEIRDLEVTRDKHITVYLPAYHYNYLAGIFTTFTDFQWHIFSPLCEEPIQNSNVEIFPVNNTGFLDSIRSCHGVITSSGFETCAEALYLGKKLLTVPIHNQYEQQCNAAALKELGVPVLDTMEDKEDQLQQWLSDSHTDIIIESANPTSLIPKILETTFQDLKNKSGDSLPTEKQ